MSSTPPRRTKHTSSLTAALAAKLAAQREAENREALSNGMRMLLAEALGAVVEASAGQPHELAVTAAAIRAAAAGLERAAMEAATAARRTPQPPGSPAAAQPSNYAEAVSVLRRRLGAAIGPFPESVAGLVLLRGEMSAAQVAKELWAWEEPGPREVIRRLLLGTLLKTPGFAADRSLAQRVATKIEIGCYNAAVRISKNAEDPPRRQWDSEGFVSIYSTRCGAIDGLLDPASEANQKYGAGLASRLLAGELLPEALGGMSVRELCPGATAAERAEIANRQSQKVVVKESNLFQCPHCYERRCTYETVQRRGLDEASDYLCECLACGREFTGRH